MTARAIGIKQLQASAAGQSAEYEDDDLSSEGSADGSNMIEARNCTVDRIRDNGELGISDGEKDVCYRGGSRHVRRYGIDVRKFYNLDYRLHAVC